MSEFQTIERGLVPALPMGLDRPLESSDVTASTRTRICRGLKASQRWLESWEVTDSPNDIPTLCLILRLCGEHAQPQVWTTPETLKLSYRIQSMLKVKLECVHMADIIMLWHGRILSRCSSDLRTLTRDWTDWRSYLAATVSWVWFFDQLTLMPPWLSENLSLFLPLLLNITDDWYPPHQQWGLLNLTKVFQFVTCQELMTNGRWHVIVNAFKRKLRSSDVEVRLTSWTSFVLALEVLERNTIQENSTFNECDQFARVILDQLQSNWTHAGRLLELQALRRTLVLLGFRMRRWCSRLFSVLDGCLGLGSLTESEALEVLGIIRLVVGQMDGKIDFHLRSILQSLIRFEVNHQPAIESDPIVLSECLAIVSILRSAEPLRYALMLEGLDRLQFQPKVLDRL